MTSRKLVTHALIALLSCLSGCNVVWKFEVDQEKYAEFFPKARGEEWKNRNIRVAIACSALPPLPILPGAPCKPHRRTHGHMRPS